MKINEIYKSIQGESTYAGCPCVFVRTTGCNLRCVYCDTGYAFYDGEEMTVAQILGKVDSFKVHLVELTGGEPLLQKDTADLVKELIDKKYTVLVETGGSLDISRIPTHAICIMDLKCPSSGEMESMNWENLQYLKPQDEVKFVIGDERDFYWAVNVVKEHRLDEKCTVLFSCVFEKLEPQKLAEWILKENLQVRLQLQLHKYIWEPAARGV